MSQAMSEATSITTNEHDERHVGVFLRIRADQKAWASREHISLSSLVRELLDEEIERRARTPPGVRRDERERARTR